jgi:hypothetical protein
MMPLPYLIAMNFVPLVIWSIAVKNV